MFFLWIRCGDNGKEYFLPRMQNWSGHLHIGRDVTASVGLNLPVTLLNGQAQLELPDGFHWVDGSDGILLEHLSRISMEGAGIRLDIYAASCTGSESGMRKFYMPDEPVTIGSSDSNVIQYKEQPVSRRHAILARGSDGSCQFTDCSRYGSYINGHLLHKASCRLSFGDRIFILPSLVLVYLGNGFAVNHSQDVIFAPVLSSLIVSDAAWMEDTAVCVEYHRAPRHVQQPREDQIEIDPPIEKEHSREMPVWLAVGPSMTMVLPMLVSSLVAGRSPLSSIAMIGTSSVLAVMWGSFNRKYQKKQSELNEQNRQKVCHQYYAEIEERIQAETERERNRLLHNFLSVNECAALPDGDSHRLWERMPSHEDFLHLRLGLGERELPVKLAIHPPKINLTDDPLRNEAQRLYDRYSVMNDVPVVVSLTQLPVLGILGERMIPWLMQSLVLQAAANHSYHDVRIAVLYGELDAQEWEFAKWLPHAYASDDRTMRMVVSNPDAVQEVLSYIDGVLSMRAEFRNSEQQNQEEAEAPVIPWYLIFCTDPSILEEHPIMRHLTAANLGVTFIIQTDSIERLPKECTAMIEAKEQLGAIYTMDGKMTGVRFESTTGERLLTFSRSIAPIRIKEIVEDSAIPSLVTFLETYHVRKVEEIDVRYFWNENHAWQSVKTILGLKAGSLPFVLDISDKNHGPHGLIAGTTGAGKSVLLQSFILSLAINYSPTEVQFILIDYKGGGTSESFRSLPHAAGIIDSLQGERMIYRALASIKGEILRREEMFKSVGVNNIDDYMKYYNNDPSEEPLSHLIIIVDEFAELKKEQPDFMRELVSAARVGRSLGLHLVLATQKPSNSVSDEIAANTRFRICLRVASRSDSSEMLKRPEAAYLRGMGRCYVQVGNDELFEQVQTSYSGAEYAPDALRPEEQPRILNDAGQPIKLKRKKQSNARQEQSQTELDAVLTYLNTTCDQYHFTRARRMWLDELPAVLLLKNVEALTAASYTDDMWPGCENELLAYYAMADDVENQCYIPVAMNLIAEKHQMICGLSGSGKTTLLQTVAVSLAMRYSPEQVNLYVFSLTSRVLGALKALPHVGDVVFEEELDEQVRLMEMIYRESEHRKKLFAQLETDNYVQFNRAVRDERNGFKPVPAIVVLIDRMQQLRDWVEQKKEDKLQLFYDMLRSASGQGIFFIITAYDRSELPGKYHSFVHGVSLQMSERMGYADALNAKVPLEWGGIREYPGRGMIAMVDKEAKRTCIYELQTAVYATAESDAKRSDMIRALGCEMRAAWKGALPKGIDRIPSQPVLSLLMQQEDMAQDMMKVDQLPIGYDKNTGKAYSLSLREVFSMMICGPHKSGKTNMIQNIASIFARKGAQIHLIGSDALVEWGRERGMNAYAYDAPEWADAFAKLLGEEVCLRSDRLIQARAIGGMEARAKLLESFIPIVILIDDLDAYIVKMGENAEAVVNLRQFFDDIVSGYGIYTFFTLSHDGYNRTKPKEPVASLTRAGRGLMLQGRLTDCDPFSLPLPFSEKNMTYPLGEGLLVVRQELLRLVLPKWDQ